MRHNTIYLLLRNAPAPKKKKKSRWGNTKVEAIPSIPVALLYESGQRVEVNIGVNGKTVSPWSPGIVQKYIKDKFTYGIFMLDDKTERSFEEKQIRKLNVINAQINQINLVPGTIVKAYYGRDGLYYDAEIVGIPDLKGLYNIISENNSNNKNNSGLYEVKYVDYGNVEILPIEYLIPKKPEQMGKMAFSTVSTARPMDESALKKIPDYLIIKDTDSEAEKERKRKKIKSIKSKNRFLKKDIESNKRQASWQNFQSSMKKKKSRFGGGHSKNKKKSRW